MTALFIQISRDLSRRRSPQKIPLFPVYYYTLQKGFSKRSSLLTDHWTFENKALTFFEQVLPQNNPDKCGGKTKKFWKTLNNV